MLGFIIAVVAGFLAKYADEPLVRPLVGLLHGKIEIEPGETRLIGFMIVMLLAGVGAELLHSGSTFWLILGGVLGYFATRLLAAVKSAIDGRGAP
jgi:hypothetical protein